MITGSVRSKVDKVWKAFWSGEVSNPLTMIEQIACLLFPKRRDDRHTAKVKQTDLLKLRWRLERPDLVGGKQAKKKRKG